MTTYQSIFDSISISDEQLDAKYWLQLENWKRFGEIFSQSADLQHHMTLLNDALAHVTYLVADRLTIADVSVWSGLLANAEFQGLLPDSIPVHIKRFYFFLSSQQAFKKVYRASIVKEKTAKQLSVQVDEKDSPLPSSGLTGGRFEMGGKFVDLPGAEMGKVVVRFPPEASGYLHIGHAKAALLNQYYRDKFRGKLIFRFDDTNPCKENEEFEKVILKDIELLGLTPDVYSFTSNHFDSLLKYCEQAILEGNAYVDFTEPEMMKKLREKREPTLCRSHSVEENMRLWNEMKVGSEEGFRCCVRMKMDIKNNNGCLRDPTIYRCKNEPHLHTGSKYFVYPTYDFACPIVDSLEGVTHALRTTEYHDRNVQYNRICDVFGLPKPYICDYSRLNLRKSLLSKRKLTWCVDEKIVEGWDDPVFPTVRGIRRRGMTVEGLKEFVVAQGSSKNIAAMSWDKIWSFNRKTIEPTSPIYTALDLNARNCVVEVTGLDGIHYKDIDAHKQNFSVGTKRIWYSPRVMISLADAVKFRVGQNVTFVDWGNLYIDFVTIREDSSSYLIKAHLNLEDNNYRNTLKVTWLPVLPDDYDAVAQSFEILTLEYGDILTVDMLPKDGDFRQYINHNMKNEKILIGDPMLKTLKKGDIIQLQRRGFYICDVAYNAEQPCTSVVLINIPSGKSADIGSSKADPQGDKKTDKREGRPSKKALKKEKLLADSVGALASNGSLKKDSQNTEIEANCLQGDKSVLDVVPLRDQESSKLTRLGLEVTKEEDFSRWYSQAITRSKFVRYYDVSGCYYIWTDAFFVWEQIQSFFDARIKSMGVQNIYAPMFVTQQALEREKSHIDDFAPEVAWVTRAGNVDLSEPVAIRPTSETVLYPLYAKEIQSHRDLPLKCNQWCNVIRWEFKHPQPFLRTREFLWQEGHSVFASRAEAEREVYEILDHYADVYEKLLAVPVIKGRKTDKEKFPGAVFTATVEGYIPGSGRGIQGATSHYLGQNFSKMFDIIIADPNACDETTPPPNIFVHQNSWGISTRTIGIMVMIHGDDKGVVIPPRVASIQVVIVPCGITSNTTNVIMDKCHSLEISLKNFVRVHADLRDNYRPGWKFNHWELIGVPLRLEVGPKDMAAGTVVVVRRDTHEKCTVPEGDLAEVLPLMLEQVQNCLYNRAKESLEANLVSLDDDFDLFCTYLDLKKLILAPFCGSCDCETVIKDISARNAVVEEGAPSMGAKTLCVPVQQPKDITEKSACINALCTKPPLYYALFGRSY